MIDYFALLGIERRPAITEETVKGAYFRKSESLHSDPARSGELIAVNAAFQAIVNPATRIQHLLVLEFGDAGGGQIAPDLGELFGTIVEVLIARAAAESATLSRIQAEFDAQSASLRLRYVVGQPVIEGDQ